MEHDRYSTASNHPVPETYAVTGTETDGCFVLTRGGVPAPIWADPSDHGGVIRALGDLKADVGRVIGKEPGLFFDETAPPGRAVVIAGTLGKNRIIDTLAKRNTIDPAVLSGKREAYLVQVVQAADLSFPGIARAFVIAGSDQRGSIYGIYDLCARIGVSPWYWWADAPVARRSDLFIAAGSWTDGEPKVRYRGIFLNDEMPALTRWANEKFGGLNHQFYEKVFELILRLKGNFLWPAMWGNSFFDDDPQNQVKAREYGIVIGTSHHEPCLRAHDEWRRYGRGPWDYAENGPAIREFWEEGIRRMEGFESLVTLGMRGDGDEPMSGRANSKVLKRIIDDQREIIDRATGKGPACMPQVWVAYKEVQDYYDKGMTVPEDVTIMLCDDNWGNLRRIPRPDTRGRSGGFGLYYHFDYVGDPRNYKWLNTSPIARVWEQLRLAYDSGIDRIWVVNVGDLKPMEFPMSFFLDFAWDPDRWPVERLPEYGRLWAESIFGPEYAPSIASFITRYTKYNGRRKPELLSPDTYSLLNYREADTVVDEYNGLLAEAEGLEAKLPPGQRDAYYQLVLHPIRACANLNELYVAAAKNRLYAAQGRSETNDTAARVRELFERDQAITDDYNHALAGGKWNHFMDQTHIGYISWQQPERNVPPDVREIEVPEAAEMGVAVEGSVKFWPRTKTGLRLPEFDPLQRQAHYIDVFNRGRTPFEVRVRADEPWVLVEPDEGRVARGLRVWAKIDWKAAPVGRAEARVIVIGPDGEVVIAVDCHGPEIPDRDIGEGFLEGGGYVSMEAEHFSRAVEREPFTWRRVPELGRTLSGMTASPVNRGGVKPAFDGPRLEYTLHLFKPGKVKVLVYASPSLDFRNEGGLRYAVSFDDQRRQTVNLHDHFDYNAWCRAVADNILVTSSEHSLSEAGTHVLHLWLVDTGVVFEKIVVDAGGVRSCYLGPPESCRRG
ncbi:MAG: glycosyl hydrolase 115 family protein [Spirochaetales bacterium]|nr:glycosyl hydrolase 115 family protein [Spirochaetales bacterium]